MGQVLGIRGTSADDPVARLLPVGLDEVLDYLQKNQPAPAAQARVATAFRAEQTAVRYQEAASSRQINLDRIDEFSHSPLAPRGSTARATKGVIRDGRTLMSSPVGR